MTPLIIYTLFTAAIVLAFFAVVALADWMKKVFKKGEENDNR